MQNLLNILISAVVHVLNWSFSMVSFLDDDVNLKLPVGLFNRVCTYWVCNWERVSSTFLGFQIVLNTILCIGGLSQALHIMYRQAIFYRRLSSQILFNVYIKIFPWLSETLFQNFEVLTAQSAIVVMSQVHNESTLKVAKIG